MAIKEVSNKELEYAKAYPGSDIEKANLLPKIIKAFGVARSKLTSQSWINADIGDVKYIEASRKGGKASSDAKVFFNVLLDGDGFHLVASTPTGDINCSNVAKPPTKDSDLREFLKDLNRFDSDLVTNSELDAFNKAHPPAELKALYELRDSPHYKFTSVLKMKGDSLKMFKTWGPKEAAKEWKDVDYVLKNPKNPPPAVLKRADALLVYYNNNQLYEIKAKIKKAEDAL